MRVAFVYLPDTVALDKRIVQQGCMHNDRDPMCLQAKNSTKT